MKKYFKSDMPTARRGEMYAGDGWIVTVMMICRAQVVPDSFDKLYNEGRDIKHTVQIAFVSGEGGLEAGIDGGGLFKEFLNQLCHEAFVPSNGLFCTTPDGLLFPNPQVVLHRLCAKDPPPHFAQNAK
jgi:hypothetical protein